MLPILIVGAGPVGLSLALALSRNQVPVMIFEADAELNREIRASTLHPPTLELLDEWGVVDGVMAKGFRVDSLMYWERETRECITRFDYGVIANDTPYGLSGYVQTGDVERGRRVAGRMRTGMVNINGAWLSSMAPFGGYKQSGNGREWGPHGLGEFLEVKSISGYETKQD